MKPFLKIIQTPIKDEYTIALFVKLENNPLDEPASKSPFGYLGEKENIAVYHYLTGESLEKYNIELPDLSSKTSIKIDGKVIKLTPAIRRNIYLSNIQAEAQLTEDKEFVKTDTEKNKALLNTEEYISFRDTFLTSIGILSASTSDLYGALKVYDGQKHMLITGMAGIGKTHTVSKYAETEDRKMFFKALDNGTETIDLTGHLIKLTNGEFAWKDGVVTQAFRAAANGEKVLLFLDELLRCPEKELSLLVGCLTPDSRGKLVLRTGRPLEDTLKDGVIEEEVIETALEHLWCVATTNQGRNYHTGRIDMALKDRFRIYEQTMSLETSKEIATEVLKKTTYGKKLGDTVIENIIEKMYKVVEAIDSHVNGDGKLKQHMTIRHITEIINTSKKVKDIKLRMLDIVANIVMIDSSGQLNREQMDIIKEYINTYIKV